MNNKTICSYCAELIDKWLDKCPYCFENIDKFNDEKEDNNTSIDKYNNKKEDDDDNNEISRKISNHLNFLWYKQDYINNNYKDWNIYLIFSHIKHPTLFVNILKYNIILLNHKYNLWKHFDNVENIIFNKIINDINSKTILTKWYKENYEDWNDSINIETNINWYDKIILPIHLNISIEEINLHISKISNLL